MLKRDDDEFWVKNLGLSILGKFGKMVLAGIGLTTLCTLRKFFEHFLDHRRRRFVL